MLCSLMAVAIALSGCGSRLDNVISEGAKEFAEGKTQREYIPISAADMMDILIAEYSGGVEKHEIAEETEEQEDSDTGKTGEDTSSTGKTDEDTSSTGKTGEDTSSTGKTEEEQQEEVEEELLPVANSFSELKEILHQQFVDTEAFIKFRSDTYTWQDVLDQYSDIYWLNVREDPVNTTSWTTAWIGTEGDAITVRIEYSDTIETIKKMKKETVKLADEVVSNLQASGLSDYEKVMAVNEYLCNTVYYPDPIGTYEDGSDKYAYEAHTAYGALHDGSAVCEGYARAAGILLDKLGVGMDLEEGDVTDGRGAHAWNLAKVDGDWYQLDICWNDVAGSYDPSRSNDYTLETDAFMRQSRNWDADLYPATPPTKYVP